MVACLYLWFAHPFSPLPPKKFHIIHTGKKESLLIKDYQNIFVDSNYADLYGYCVYMYSFVRLLSAPIFRCQLCYLYNICFSGYLIY